jgi:predicted  nucleic acid-binding Zn-ribbon protein
MSSKIADLEAFKSLDQLKYEVASLKRENNAAMKTIDKLLKDVSQKNEEIKHLHSLVTQTVPVIKKESSAIAVSITPEEEIAQLQLERLRKAAQNRTLTLEETRMFDLLVKNKRLSQDESTINLSKAHYRDVSDADLLQIASKDESDETDHNS